MSIEKYWDNIYRSKAPDAVSWYQRHLETSLALIQKAAPERSSSIIDVGAGEATLVDDLLIAGYQNTTVMDVSATAIDVTKARLGSAGELVHWIVGDILTCELPNNAYDIWHDRAVFHFLTANEQRAAYVRQVARAVKPGGHVLVGTFGPDGPTKCSGLDVVRYDADSLHAEFGARFRKMDSVQEMHSTPFGTTQQFLYSLCRVE